MSAGGINPLLLNSLFGGMDLSSLQSLQSLQLAAGLMAFPPPTDPKQTAANTAAASMLPLMLPSMGGLPNMAALPNMFTLGGLFGGNLAATTAAATSSNPVSVAAGTTNGTTEGEGGTREGSVMAKKKREEEEEKEERDDRDEAGEDEEEAEGNEEGVKAKKKKTEEGAGKPEKSVGDVSAAAKMPTVEMPAEVSINGDTAALLAAAGMSANSLAFNPFLLSTMAPGLLYPSMFLPPGLAGLSLPGFATASTLAELQSTMAGAMGDGTSTPNPPRDEEEDKRESVKSAGEEEEEEDRGAERDLDEGGAEGETAGAAEHPALDQGGVEEEAAASPQKSD